MDKPFYQVWEQLRSRLPLMPSFLERVTISGIRGMNQLRIPFLFPVSVIAGQNASGKSTVLFALACAYKVPGKKVRENSPSALFPDFSPQSSDLPSDDRSKTIILDYGYRHDNADEGLSMRWRRGKSWNRSFFGRQGASQPERQIYLRTLSSMSNPSEVRGFLSLHKKSSISVNEVDANLVRFAEQILPFRYEQLISINNVAGRKFNFLFARQEKQSSEETGASYSEFHMSGGERAVLHLSMEISKLQNALVLIDEVETGLHPHAQEKLMLQLQRLAFNNNLQIVVTTHSSVILNSVPMDARIFLERTESSVERKEPYKDLVQSALYGRVHDTLSVLCEDEISESILLGVMDYLTPRMDVRFGRDVRIGRDTGSTEFSSHFKSLEKFGMEKSFLFVMDGDVQNEAEKFKSKHNLQRIPNLPSIMCLPGDKCPEDWIWDMMKQNPNLYADMLGRTAAVFQSAMSEKEQLYNTAEDKASNIAKYRLESFADAVNAKPTDIARKVARQEADNEQNKDMYMFVSDMEKTISHWRSML